MIGGRRQRSSLAGRLARGQSDCGLRMGAPALGRAIFAGPKRGRTINNAKAPFERRQSLWPPDGRRAKEEQQQQGRRKRKRRRRRKRARVMGRRDFANSCRLQIECRPSAAFVLAPAARRAHFCPRPSNGRPAPRRLDDIAPLGLDFRPHARSALKRLRRRLGFLCGPPDRQTDAIGPLWGASRSRFFRLQPLQLARSPLPLCHSRPAQNSRPHRPIDRFAARNLAVFLASSCARANCLLATLSSGGALESADRNLFESRAPAGHKRAQRACQRVRPENPIERAGWPTPSSLNFTPERPTLEAGQSSGSANALSKGWQI